MTLLIGKINTKKRRKKMSVLKLAYEYVPTTNQAILVIDKDLDDL